MNRLRRLLTGIFVLILAGNLGVPMLLDPKPIQPTDISSTSTQSPDNLNADLGLTGLLPDLRAQIAEAMKSMLESASKAASDVKSDVIARSLAALDPAEKSALAPYLWPNANNALSEPAEALASTSEDAAILPLGLPTANMLNPDGLATTLNPLGISSYLQKIITTPSCSLPTTCSTQALP
jgi:hypothetical protein